MGCVQRYDLIIIKL